MINLTKLKMTLTIEHSLSCKITSDAFLGHCLYKRF